MGARRATSGPSVSPRWGTNATVRLTAEEERRLQWVKARFGVGQVASEAGATPTSMAKLDFGGLVTVELRDRVMRAVERLEERTTSDEKTKKACLSG